ncbi:MAG: helix-turn-helix transcriptional regulator [Planctomycetes bacterium]|nr:helix-turn-helix transcriptional regulator [Planctomycetota bacterium]
MTANVTESAASEQPLLVPLTAGVPFYSLRHGTSTWTPGQRPSFMLYDDWDLFWVQRGEVTLDLKRGRRLVTGVDEFAMLPPFTPGVLSASKPGVVLAFCHFSFRIPPTMTTEPRHQDLNGPGAEALLPLHFTRDDAPGVWQAYRELLELGAPAPGEPWRLERALVTLVAKLAEFAVRRTRAHRPGVILKPERLDPRLETIRERIEADPAFRWRVSTLAAEVGVSPSQLQRMHAATFQTSLKHHIVTRRLELSIRLLRDRRDGRLPSIREVSEACGFSSQNFFSRQFKARFRVTPLAYRNGELTA